MKLITKMLKLKLKFTKPLLTLLMKLMIW